MSITIDNFSVGSIQSSIFIKDYEFSASRFMSKLYPKWADIFPGDPEVLPVPPETGLPPEIPRVVLQKKDGSARLEVAPSRLNLHQRITDNANGGLIAQCYQDSISLFSDFLNEMNCFIWRLAAVKASYAAADNPGLFLAKHFCRDQWNEKPLNDPTNFEMHSHKRYVFRGRFKVNSWVRSKTGRKVEKSKKSPIILVEQDINTLTEDMGSVQFGHDDIGEFFSTIDDEFLNILSLYYPLKGS